MPSRQTRRLSRAGLWARAAVRSPIGEQQGCASWLRAAPSAGAWPSRPGKQQAPLVPADACIHDRAIGTEVVRFGDERQTPSVPALATRAPARLGRRDIAELERVLTDVSSH